MTGVESLGTHAGEIQWNHQRTEMTPLSDTFHSLFALFVNTREYIKDMNYGDASQITVNSMIPLFDNDVFELNGKYDYEHHQNAVRFMLYISVRKHND